LLALAALEVVCAALMQFESSVAQFALSMAVFDSLVGKRLSGQQVGTGKSR
jgi:hypothetical protein